MLFSTGTLCISESSEKWQLLAPLLQLHPDVGRRDALRKRPNALLRLKKRLKNDDSSSSDSEAAVTTSPISSNGNCSEPEDANDVCTQANTSFVLMREEILHLFAHKNLSAQLAVAIGVTACEYYDRFVRGNRAAIIDVIVYCFYAAKKNWCVRAGIKFGCNFLLYATNPQSCHSTYAVYIVDMNQKGSASSWTDVIAAVRSSRQVKKKSVFALVEATNDISNWSYDDFVNKVDSIAVREIVLSKWSMKRFSQVPNKNALK